LFAKCKDSRVATGFPEKFVPAVSVAFYRSFFNSSIDYQDFFGFLIFMDF